MTRIRELEVRCKAVARAMLVVWNPIGVEGLPEDEYVSYAPVVVGMFERDESDRAAAEYLISLERDRMGLPQRRPEDLMEVVQALRAAT